MNNIYIGIIMQTLITDISKTMIKFGEEDEEGEVEILNLHLLEHL